VRVTTLGIDNPESYGIGFYSGRGAMKDSVVCPIHSIDSEIIGYCSFESEKEGVISAYPPDYQFAKDADLFNVHRAKDRIKEDGLCIVKDPFDAIYLSERGYNAVAFMDELPGSRQINKLYDFYTQEMGTCTFFYTGIDSPKRIGKTILALCDLPIVVAPLP